MLVKTKSPMRIDLSGGTLDLWPVHLIIDNCKTINLSISIYSYCELEKLDGKSVDPNVQLKGSVHA